MKLANKIFRQNLNNYHHHSRKGSSDLSTFSAAVTLSFAKLDSFSDILQSYKQFKFIHTLQREEHRVVLSF